MFVVSGSNSFQPQGEHIPFFFNAVVPDRRAVVCGISRNTPREWTQAQVLKGILGRPKRSPYGPRCALEIVR